MPHTLPASERKRNLWGRRRGLWPAKNRRQDRRRYEETQGRRGRSASGLLPPVFLRCAEHVRRSGKVWGIGQHSLRRDTRVRNHIANFRGRTIESILFT